MEFKSYQLEKQLISSPESFWEPPAYLFLGEESFLKEDLLDAMIKKLHITKDGLLRLDAAIMSGEEVLSTLNTMHLSDERVVVIIENADKIPNDTCQKLYVLWEKNGFPEESLPIFIAESVTNRKLWGLIKEEGTWCKFYHMFSDGVPKWTLNKMQQAKIKAERGVEFIISNLCNLNLRQIAKEIEKLALTDDYLTAELVKKYIKSTEAVDKFMVEDKFMARELIPARTLMEKLLSTKGASIKEIIFGFIRLTRHAIQARHYIDTNKHNAGTLANLGGQLLTLTAGDWQTISAKIDISKGGNSEVNKVPMLEKMEWTGKLNFTAEAIDETEVEDGSDKKNRKKLLTYDVDKEVRLAEIEAKKSQRKWEESELYNYNIWYQKNIYGILKTFYMATVYTLDELTGLLLELLKIHEAVYYQGEYQMKEKLDCLLIKLITGKDIKA